RCPEAKRLVQDLVSFGNELHVTVLNAVVDHLHEVAGTIGPDVGDTRARIALRGNGLKDGSQVAIGFSGASGHQRRTMAGALFATGNAHSEEADHGLAGVEFTPNGVLEVGITAVDYDVARGE